MTSPQNDSLNLGLAPRVGGPKATLITQIAGLQPTYSVREAAVLLGRSYSWLDQRLRHGEFVRADGTILQPLRSPGRYRYFTFQMLIDIAACCYRRRWYSFDQLNSGFHVLAVAAYRDAGDYEIPAGDLLKQLSSRMAIECEYNFPGD